MDTVITKVSLSSAEEPLPSRSGETADENTKTNSYAFANIFGEESLNKEDDGISSSSSNNEDSELKDKVDTVKQEYELTDFEKKKRKTRSDKNKKRKHEHRSGNQAVKIT